MLIKVCDLDIGQVKCIEFNFDLNGVIVIVCIDNNVVYLLNENIQFWVVVLCILFFEVFGLNMLLFGSFIVMIVESGNQEVLQFMVFECFFVILFGMFGLYVKFIS